MGDTITEWESNPISGPGGTRDLADLAKYFEGLAYGESITKDFSVAWPREKIHSNIVRIGDRKYAVYTKSTDYSEVTYYVTYDKENNALVYFIVNNPRVDSNLWSITRGEHGIKEIDYDEKFTRVIQEIESELSKY